jgi:pyruvate dehydrogenase E1 component alpha subunit
MHEFNVPYHRILNQSGILDQPLPGCLETPKDLISAYQSMVFCRAFDKKMVALQRTGQLGTYPSSLGHEAIGVAIGKAMHRDDVFVPYYRDMATQLERGVSLYELLMYWGGDERGSDFAVPRQDFPVCVPIATQSLHAAGVASAMKIRHQKRAVVTTIGDGGSSKADFLEALNVAGAWHLPVVFVIANNQWAISVPRAIQCGGETLAQKGIGAGLACMQVDGNDYLAMYQQMSLALDKARQGKGATVIEAITYRLSDHTTADDATRYRDAEQVSAAWQAEPIKRLQTYLHQQGLWDEAQELAFLAETKEEIDQAVACYLDTPAMKPQAMLEHLWAQMPCQLDEQYQRLQTMAPSNLNGGVCDDETRR